MHFTLRIWEGYKIKKEESSRREYIRNHHYIDKNIHFYQVLYIFIRYYNLNPMQFTSSPIWKCIIRYDCQKIGWELS